MLTKEAYNALLKTLEEPPAHVMFILATTNLEKVPQTIISRCQAFAFKQPIMRDLSQYVIDVVTKEELMMDVAAAELVALAGDGSYRDTLSVLEKVLTVAEGKKALSADVVARIIGAPRHEIINRILRGIDSGNSEDALLAVRDADMEHVDMTFFMRLVLMKLRAVLLLRYAPQMEATIAEEFSPDDVALIRGLANSKDKRINSHTLLEFLRTGELSKAAIVPTLPIEIAIIRALGEK
jgi:DNA polymerase-3 subunit gamma/tau